MHCVTLLQHVSNFNDTVNVFHIADYSSLQIDGSTFVYYVMRNYNSCYYAWFTYTLFLSSRSALNLHRLNSTATILLPMIFQMFLGNFWEQDSHYFSSIRSSFWDKLYLSFSFYLMYVLFV